MPLQWANPIHGFRLLDVPVSLAMASEEAVTAAITPAASLTLTAGPEPQTAVSRYSVVQPALNQSLIAGLVDQQVRYLTFAISLPTAATDAILGRHVTLVGVLIAGPCCGLLTGGWARTATAGT